jgi:CheY-like chemotaxis protein
VRPKVIVGYFDEAERNRAVAAVTAAGFDPVKATTGREVLERLGQAADIDLILIDQALPYPGLSNLLGQLRSDVNIGLLPVVLTAPSRDREEALRRYVAPWPNVTVVRDDVLGEPQALKAILGRRIVNPDQPALTPAERKDYAERSIVLLDRLARNDPPGFDVKPAAGTILEALRAPSRLRPEGQIAAADAVSRLGGREAQEVLADVVLDGKRPAAVRVAAAAGLVRHIQAFRPALSRTHVASLATLNDLPGTDAPLKAQLALVLGSLQPNARLTGERLLQYQPPVPAPPTPPKKD